MVSCETFLSLMMSHRLLTRPCPGARRPQPAGRHIHENSRAIACPGRATGPLDNARLVRRPWAVADSCILPARVIPNARRDEVVGWVGDGLKVKVRAPALDGRANEAVCGLLSQELGLARGAVAVARGDKSRSKLLEVRGLTADAVRARLGRRA